MRRRPEMRSRPDVTESPSTGSGGSLPSFVLTAFLYIERSCARIILIDNLHVYRSIYSNSVILWRRKGGVSDKKLEGDKKFLLLSMFLHPVGKGESALFFLLAVVFPTWFSLQRF